MPSKKCIQLPSPSPKTLVSTVASITTFLMLFRSFVKQFIPKEFKKNIVSSFAKELAPKLKDYIVLKLTTIIRLFFTEYTIVIEEFDGLKPHKLYHAANLYLKTLITPDTKQLRATLSPKDEQKITISMDKNTEIIDRFNGVSFKWQLTSVKTNLHHDGSDKNDSIIDAYVKQRYFELSFPKRHKDMVIDTYLPYVLDKAKTAQQKMKHLKLFTLGFHGSMSKPWQSVKLIHPATFDTLAMDSAMKRKIFDDLDRFLRRKDYYKRVGKAWKRGYLLFGPPGTGKSTLIAAMANYLKFDVYDLEFASINSNTDLRRILLATENKSILVVEDIDCSINARKRLGSSQVNKREEVTLSGLLNFIDGLWSSCGDERIIVFTTNHKHLVDPALLRPGRMDFHIHMSYCTPCGFKMLAYNYLGITQHPLFLEVEHLIETKKVTPAEVSEQLMKEEEPDIALRGLIEFIKRKEIESDGDLIAVEEEEIEASEIEEVQTRMKHARKHKKSSKP